MLNVHLAFHRSLRAAACVCLMGTIALLAPCDAAAASMSTPYLYLSPTPGSQHVSPHNNIVVRSHHDLDAAAIKSVTLTVAGARSGPHAGTLTLSDDVRTLVFRSAQPFSLGEQVSVRFDAGTAAHRADLPPLSFSFTVAKADPKRKPRMASDDGTADQATEATDQLIATTARVADAGSRPAAARPRKTTASSVPPSYPPITIFNANDPEPGHLFLTPNSDVGHLVIMDNRGYPIFYRRNPGRVADFKAHPDGTLSYFNSALARFYRLDAAGAVIDSFETGNGYVTDLHDFLLLPNGHALLMAYDPQPVGMDTVVSGGNPNATVVGLIIQEIDAAKNVVFQWRSWDHFEITDAVECVVNLLAADVDYAHGNAFEVDLDGHILISSRHMNEITKINRQTGAIIWRLGLLAKNNQFTFVGDTRGFSHQHDIRRHANGNITLFDNGNCSTPQYSRAVEYALDETHKIATLVWEYRLTPDIYGRATGNVQRRANGSTLINWGFGARVTDLHANGSKSLELDFGAPNRTTYRAFRFPWRTTRFETGADSLGFGTVLVGDSSSRSLSIRNEWTSPVEIDELASSNAAFLVPFTVPFTLAPEETVVIPVRFKPLYNGPFTATLYVRAANDSELVAQTVELTGAGSGPVAVENESPGRGFALAAITNPSRGAATIEFVTPRAAPVRLTVLDVQGRVVAVLADGVHASGRHQVLWGTTGRATAPPGLYLVRYEWPGSSAVRRLILMQ